MAKCTIKFSSFTRHSETSQGFYHSGGGQKCRSAENTIGLNAR